MSVRITTQERKVALFDSTNGLAFGPVFETEDDAEEFLEHLTEIGERDPRFIPAAELAAIAYDWEQEREAA